MCGREPIEPITFSILERLMALQELTNFSLVGGTALAAKAKRLSQVKNFSLKTLLNW